MEIRKIEFNDYDKVLDFTWQYEKRTDTINIVRDEMCHKNINKYNLLDGTHVYYGAFVFSKIIGVIGYSHNKILFAYSDDQVVINKLLKHVLNEMRSEYYYEMLLSKRIEENDLNLEKTNNEDFPKKYVIRT